MASPPAPTFRSNALSEFFAYTTYFHSIVGKPLWVIIAFMLVSSLLEGLGIAIFFPLLRQHETGAIDLGGDSRIVMWLNFLHIDLTFNSILFLMASIFALRGAVKCGEIIIRSRLLTSLTVNMRKKAVSGYCNLDYRYFESAQKGSLGSLLTTEVGQAIQAFHHFLNLLLSLCSAAALTALTLATDWKVSLMGMGACIVIGIPLQKLARFSLEYSRKNAAANIRINGMILQALSSFKYLKSTAGFGKLSNQFSAAIDEVRENQRHIGVLEGITAGLNQSVSALVLVGLIYMTVIVQGKTLALILFALLLLYRIINQIINAMGAWQAFASFRGHLDSVATRLEEFAANREVTGSIPSSGSFSKISFRNVEVQVGETRILKSINLEISRGAVVGIVGSSGSGKTTITDVITGTIKPTHGTVLVDDTDLSSIDLASWRSKIGFVCQDSVIFNDTIFNNITLWSESPESPEALARMNKVLELVHLETLIQRLPLGVHTNFGEKGINLSGGQKQRLAFARELFQQPELLLLDEATSAMDQETESILSRNLTSYKGAMTMIIVSHRPALLHECDLIYVVDAGEVIEQGTFNELSQNPTSAFKRIFVDTPAAQIDRSERIPIASEKEILFVAHVGEEPHLIPAVDISLSGIGLKVDKLNPLLSDVSSIMGHLSIDGALFRANLSVARVTGNLIGCRITSISNEGRTAISDYLRRQAALRSSSVQVTLDEELETKETSTA